jgi:hypothetical protein
MNRTNLVGILGTAMFITTGVFAQSKPPVVVGGGSAGTRDASPASKRGGAGAEQAAPKAGRSIKERIGAGGGERKSGGRAIAIPTGSSQLGRAPGATPGVGGTNGATDSGEPLLLRSGTSMPSIAEILAGWGGNDPDLDLDGDGVVGGSDLAIALSNGANSGGSTVSDEGITAPAGSGFEGPTAEPEAQGTAGEPGFDARAIARWDFVPHQTFSEPFNVGVVAFHSYGIDRVEFSVNGGPWTAVREMTLNPDSGVVEYWVRVDPSQLPTGEAEIRAIVYPTTGQCRVLGGEMTGAGEARGEYGMNFVADSTGTLPRVERFVSPDGSDASGDGSRENPFATMMRAAKSIAQASGGKADGGRILLLPGEHNFGTYTYSLLTTVSDRWLEIAPAPGVAASEAPIVSASTGGLRIPLVRFRGVEFRPSGGTNGLILGAGSGPRSVWVDGCSLIGCGKQLSSDWMNGWDFMYSTDCFLTNCRNGMRGAELVRDLTIDEIGSDAFSDGRMVLNSTVRRIDRTGTEFHPDFYQLYAPLGASCENRIVYGVRALEPLQSQGFFADGTTTVRDLAFVNCSVSTLAPGNVMRAFQYGGPTSNMFVMDCEILGPALWRPDLTFTADDIVFRNVSWSGNGPAPSPLAGVTEYEE